MSRRILYATAAYDEAEIDAVLGVLRGGPNALRIGKNVREMEERVAELFGKRNGVLVSSGSAALFLAIDLLNLQPGDEVITSPLTFSTDLSPLIRADAVPVFVDIEPDTFQIDVDRIEAEITPRTKALLVPNLAGNAPDWDRLRDIADAHQLVLIEDSCDALGTTLRGTPTGTRSHISVTSFSLSHILTTAGQGGMVLLDDDELRDRCLTLRGWGRRSERQLYGSTRGDRDFWTELDGLRYDNLFIFDEPGWNFLPNEINAAFGVEQLKKLPANRKRRQANFERYMAFLTKHPDRFIAPRQTEGLDTAWLSFCFLLHPEAGFTRSDLQAYLEPRGIDTRVVWTGNAARQPMMKTANFRVPTAGLPNADSLMEYGILLPCGQALTDDDVDFVTGHLQGFLDQRHAAASKPIDRQFMEEQ
jgi:CDP-6-deoxy-D-xylo-4-hexulose-3-dehydrase